MVISELHYALRQKLVSFGVNFTIQGEDGSTYQVRGEPMTLSDKISLQDRDGNELAYISMELQLWRSVYEIHRQNHPMTEVRRVWSAFPRHRFAIEAGDDGDLAAVGDFLDLEYIVKRGDRDVARFTKQWFHLSDTWGIDVDNNEDQVFMLSLAVIIARCRERMWSRN